MPKLSASRILFPFAGSAAGAPNVGAAAKWSLDFLVQWRERIQATRAVKAWKEGAA